MDICSDKSELVYKLDLNQETQDSICQMFSDGVEKYTMEKMALLLMEIINLKKTNVLMS
jgi:hypothetical protein